MRAAHAGEARTTGDEAKDAGCYVYGIVPNATAMDDALRGVGAPASSVQLLPHRRIAAVISDVRVDDTLLWPESIVAHKRLLDTLSASTPVLPLRFGAVLDDRDAVEGTLLGPGHDRFQAALSVLAGRAQYLIKGRYAEERLLTEVLADDPRVAWLRARVDQAGSGSDSRDLRMQLGAAVNEAVAARRAFDTELLLEAAAPWCVASGMRGAGDPYDAVNVAVLVDLQRRADLQRTVANLGRRWADRVELQVLGPMAAYDFADAAVAGDY